MKGTLLNKRKIFNDPIYGFVNIPDELAFDVVEHPWFQRLRRIKQLGLTPLVYPGALHTRFAHALGSMHLMTRAVETLRFKDCNITKEEAHGLYLAILLHDIGHGPFSHALEHSITENLGHEQLSSLFIRGLNSIFDGNLSVALAIFEHTHPKKFLHQLVSSQLDVDRLDYLTRDSFYTGVSEGIIGTDRIIKMLNVKNDELVVDSKGVYSIEKFLVSRRLMYWQVYLHKTVLAAEHLIIKILQRARWLAEKGHNLFASPALSLFLHNRFTTSDFTNDSTLLGAFSELDDVDVLLSIKVWQRSNDKILADLCGRLVNRHLFRIEMQELPFDDAYINRIRQKTGEIYGYDDDGIDYFVFHGSVDNHAYHPGFDRINILFRGGEVVDITECSDLVDVAHLSKPVTRNFLCYPKDCTVTK